MLLSEALDAGSAPVITAIVLCGLLLLAVAFLALRHLGPASRRARAARERPAWPPPSEITSDTVLPKRVMIIGGGAVGLQTAYRLQKKLPRHKAVITVVDPHARLTYLPFLPEAAAGSIEPRHVVVPLHRVLHSCEIITGHVTSIDHAHHAVDIQPVEGPARQERYDVLVVAAGSIVRSMPVPGLDEHAIGLKTLSEAIYLRDHVLQNLEVASSTRDPEVRRRALTFVGVGGGFAGVEVLAELEDMARDASTYYPNLSPDMMQWVLVEAGPRLMPELGEDMSRYTVDRLSRRGIQVKLSARVESLEGGIVRLSTGESFAAETVIWTAGVRANPLAERSDLPLDERFRIKCTPDLAVEGVSDAWAAGDIAGVPDVTVAGATCGPTAQHAIRQANRLADNILRSLNGQSTNPYRHKNAGSVASLGLHKGVAQVYGIKLHGWPAWMMHRAYHVMRMPTIDRRLRILLDWTLGMFFHRDIVSLSDFENPRAQFQEALHAEGAIRVPESAATPSPASKIARPRRPAAPRVRVR